MCGPACMQGCGWQVYSPLQAFDVGTYMPPNGSRDFLNVFHVIDRLYDSSRLSCGISPCFSALMEWY